MDDLLESLARYDTPTLANAIETFDLQPRQEVARAAVREYIDRTSRQELLDEVLDDELPRFAEALRRLGE